MRCETRAAVLLLLLLLLFVQNKMDIAFISKKIFFSFFIALNASLCTHSVCLLLLQKHFKLRDSTMHALGFYDLPFREGKLLGTSLYRWKMHFA